MLRSATSLLLLVAVGVCLASDPCNNFNGENPCVGQQTNQFPGWDSRRWQTPPPSAPEWQPAYQSYHALVAYPRVQYASDMQSAVVTVVYTAADPSASLLFHFGDAPPSTSPSITVTASTQLTPLRVVVTSADGSLRVETEPVDLVWNAPVVQTSPLYQEGQRGAIVELFGWPHADIEKECASIAKAGWLGVKIYPPQESVFSYEWLQDGVLNHWDWMYQPVSYKLSGRGGSRDALRSMIYTCRKLGVRVYADAVVNHMTGGGNDAANHRNGQGGGCTYWGPKNATAGSPYYTQDFNYELNNYTSQHPALEYPSVPYSPEDFHCERPLNSWADPFDLNYGWLVGLSDLNTEREYVQQRIADYITDLLSIGISGIRIDAAKHISPTNLSQIFARLKANMGGQLPKDFLAYLEVLIGGEKDLLCCQNSSYNYYLNFNELMLQNGLTMDEVDKILLWDSSYPKEFPICGYWVMPAQRFAVENDCSDDQNPGSSSRDMGDQGSVLLKDRDVPKHRGFEEKLFARTDGQWNIKLVLSSYTFMNSGSQGIPDGQSDCSLCRGPQCQGCKTVPFSRAHDDSVCGYTVYDAQGNWAEGVYTRVHRDRSIILAMRAWLGLPVNVTNDQIGLPPQCS